MATKKTQGQGPTDIRRKWFMTQSTDSLRRRLKKYPELSDEWVQQQLNNIGKGDLYFPGVSDAIRKHAVQMEESYLKHPEHQKFRALPENEALATRVAKQTGEPYAQKIGTLTPQQQMLQNETVEMARQVLPRQYAKIGQPTQLEQPVNQAMLDTLNRIQQGTYGNEYLSGINAVFPGLKENLSGLGQTINPYLQQGLQQGGQLARGGYNQAQSYLSAAQPYAQKAADLGSDIYNQIRQPAMNAGKQTIQGLGSLLNMLKGRI